MSKGIALSVIFLKKIDLRAVFWRTSNLLMSNLLVCSQILNEMNKDESLIYTLLVAHVWVNGV